MLIQWDHIDDQPKFSLHLFRDNKRGRTILDLRTMDLPDGTCIHKPQRFRVPPLLSIIVKFRQKMTKRLRLRLKQRHNTLMQEL